MGAYIEPGEVKNLTTIDALQNLKSDQIDELYILPAEEMLKEAYRLEVNTDDIPWAWEGIFDNKPRLQTKFLADCKRATMLIINRMAQNPHGYRMQSLRGASVIYDTDIPEAADAIMAKWAKKPIVYRT
jgi:hypothetical protein